MFLALNFIKGVLLKIEGRTTRAPDLPQARPLESVAEASDAVELVETVDANNKGNATNGTMKETQLPIPSASSSSSSTQNITAPETHTEVQPIKRKGPKRPRKSRKSKK